MSAENDNEDIGSKLRTIVQTSWPLTEWAIRNVIVAVSGGVDSVALAHLIHQIHSENSCQGQLVFAHFNHRLRGTESDEDMEFVKALASQLGRRFVSESAAEPGNIADPGIELVARNQRYAFFKNVANQWGARFVAVAHHADDQTETIVHRFARGTSVAGLRGIPTIRLIDSQITLIRPLLLATHKQLQDYLQTIRQEFREDPTNQCLNVTRNRIRLEVLPLLRQAVHPAADQAIQRLGKSAGEYHQLLLDVVEPIVQSACRMTENSVWIEVEKIQRSRPLVQRQVFVECWNRIGWPVSDMSSEKWEMLIKAIEPANDSMPPFELPGKIRVTRSAKLIKLESQFE
jgi:tRNA(Ile)-lysidine synthase